jgi:hypothetical protein
MQPSAPDVSASLTDARSAPGDVSPSPERCVSCDARLAGTFCVACGERRLRADEHSLRRFFAESFAAVTSLDARLYRTVRALAVAPGRLTEAYMAGRRTPYLRPLQLFVLANLVYFFVQPYSGISGYNTPLRLQIEGQFYSDIAHVGDLVARRTQELGITPETYAAIYDAKSEIYAKSLLLLLVPLLAVAVALLEFRRGRFVQHLVFAVHYVAWQLIFIFSMLLLVLPFFVGIVVNGLSGLGVDVAGSVETPLGSVLWFMINEMPSMPLEVAYLAVAFRRVYGNTIAGAVTRGLLMMVALLGAMLVYRFLLFWITYASA